MKEQIYTEEETKYMIDKYTSVPTLEEKKEVVKQLAKELNKSENSIRTKLVIEGVYQSSRGISKITGGKPKTKFQMVTEMEKEFNFPINSLEGLEKAPKLVLMRIYNKLKEFQNAKTNDSSSN